VILVLSTYRSASTWYCNQLEHSTKYTNLNECFHESISDHRMQLRHVLRSNKTIVKLFPYHSTQSNITELTDTLVDMASQVVVLGRRNTYEQIKSYYIAKTTKHWHGDVDDTIHINYNADLWNSYRSFMLNEIQTLKTYQSRYSTELVFTEDLDQQGRYNRHIVWDHSPPYTESMWN
jgi:LPS sulfotransferase NodH